MGAGRCSKGCCGEEVGGKILRTKNGPKKFLFSTREISVRERGRGRKRGGGAGARMPKKHSDSGLGGTALQAPMMPRRGRSAHRKGANAGAAGARLGRP